MDRFKAFLIIAGVAVAAIAVGAYLILGTVREIAFQETIEGRLVDVRTYQEKSQTVYEGNLILHDGSVFSFVNTDNLALGGKTNSADYQGKLATLKGQCIRAQFAGWRVPLLSWLPNIFGQITSIPCNGFPTVAN